MLAKSPGFTAIAVLTLALGIGVNLALFTLLNDQLLRPRDVLRPDELWSILPADASGEPKFFHLSQPYYEAIRKDNRAFSSIVGYSHNLGPKLRTADGTQQIRALLVSGDFFGFLGVQPVLGRGFLPEEDDKPGTHSVAVISHRFWQEHFQGDPTVLGKTVSLDDRIVEIVGFAPRGFKGIGLYQPACWLPMSMEKLFGSVMGYNLLGRLRDGITASQAADALAPVVRDMTKTLMAGGDSDYNNNISQFTRVAVLREGYGSLPSSYAWLGRKDMAKAASLVGIATLLVLLIAGSNLANLLLARSLRRRKEMATRLALGATRWTLIRQFLLEGMLLAGFGAVTAIIALQWLGNDAAKMMPGVVYARADIDLHPDIRVAVFALAIALAVGVGFSLLPALRMSRLDPLAVLKDPDGAGSHRRHGSLGRLLMIAQIAASLVLLSGTGLCLHAIARQLRIDVGFPTKSIAVASVDLESVGYKIESSQPVVEDIRRRLSLLPGVEAVGVMDMAPLRGGDRRHIVYDRLDGYAAQPGEKIVFGFTDMGPDGFRALGIPVIEGRDISQNDWSTDRPVMLVNESFVKKFWPNQTVIGKRMDRFRRSHEVIGIARDARFETMSTAPEPSAFFAAGASQVRDLNFIVRTKQDPKFLLQPITAELAKIHPGLRRSRVSTLAQLMLGPLRVQRETMSLLGKLGALALGLTVLGVFGMMSALVTQRTRELGIRIAVGAQRTDIAKLILGSGAALGLAGIGIGLPAAFCGSLLLRHAVFGVSPFDAASFLLAAAAVLTAILVACAIPARRATKVDPIIALKQE
jgi:predicted permease